MKTYKDFKYRDLDSGLGENLLQAFLKILAIIMVIDLFGAIWWVISGQIPISGIYIGAITTNIVNSII